MRPDEMSAAIVRNLPAKTGRSLDQWIEIVRREGRATRKERVAWLRAAYETRG